MSQPTASPPRVPLSGDVTVRDDSTKPPPPAEPTWLVAKGTAVGDFHALTVAALLTSDGDTVGYSSLEGEWLAAARRSASACRAAPP